MDQVLQNAPATIKVAWYENAVLVDPGVVTVTITRDDGTAIVTNGATVGTGAAQRTYTLSTAETAQLDRLTVVWTSPARGKITTYVEIVGGFLCTLADIKAPLASDPGAEKLAEARTRAETLLEDVCGVAFRPRYAREVFDGSGSDELLLGNPRPLAVSVVKVDGTALDAQALSELTLDPAGLLIHPGLWAAGRRSVEVTYSHGYPQPFVAAVRPAVKLATSYLIADPTNFHERASRVDMADASYSLVTPGVRGTETSIPEVNAFIERYRYHEGIA
ncbi:MAG: hypothetical protein M3355_12085 [Actinomycetota bacterium]|nr:hypothetical protein [Actinomycetota bacterium]